MIARNQYTVNPIATWYPVLWRRESDKDVPPHHIKNPKVPQLPQPIKSHIQGHLRRSWATEERRLRIKIPLALLTPSYLKWNPIYQKFPKDPQREGTWHLRLIFFPLLLKFVKYNFRRYLFLYRNVIGNFRLKDLPFYLIYKLVV